MPDPAAKPEARASNQRRRRRKKPRQPPRPNPATPDAVIARVADAKAVVADKPVEEPLGPEELAEIRQHLRFLRDHRRVLHLRVNAQEDLLLNEVREPARRGVWLHLLSKVERAHVFSASERLDPKAALRLAEGVLRIWPNIDYLLLYLDCVRRAQSAPQAVLALSRALERIDASQLSPGQMRRVLDLLVELLEPRQLPLMLLGLLESAAFRQAFDASVAELPQALAELVVPLRAVQAVVLHGKHARFDADALERGMRLLLAADADALARRSPAVRRRLLGLAIESGLARDPELAASLSALLAALGSDAAASKLGFELAREWIAAERETEAKRLLERLATSGEDAARAQRWLRALDQPRVGRIALTQAPEAGSDRRLPGVYLGSMRAATYCELQAAELELWHGVLVPGVVPVLERGESTVPGRVWVAVARPGRRLPALLERRGQLDRADLGSACAQACRLLATLGALGIELPDARLARFELDASARLWLCDLRGARHTDAASADRAHARLCTSFCRALFDLARDHLAPGELIRSLERCQSANDCARLLASELG